MFSSQKEVIFDQSGQNGYHPFGVYIHNFHFGQSVLKIERFNATLDLYAHTNQRKFANVLKAQIFDIICFIGCTNLKYT